MMRLKYNKPNKQQRYGQDIYCNKGPGKKILWICRITVHLKAQQTNLSVIRSTYHSEYGNVKYLNCIVRQMSHLQICTTINLDMLHIDTLRRFIAKQSTIQQNELHHANSTVIFYTHRVCGTSPSLNLEVTNISSYIQWPANGILNYTYHFFVHSSVTFFQSFGDHKLFVTCTFTTNLLLRSFELPKHFNPNFQFNKVI